MFQSLKSSSSVASFHSNSISESFNYLNMGNPLKFDSIDAFFTDILEDCTFKNLEIYKSPLTDSISQRVMKVITQNEGFLSYVFNKGITFIFGCLASTLAITLQQFFVNHLEIVLEAQKKSKKYLVLLSYGADGFEHKTVKYTTESQKQDIKKGKDFIGRRKKNVLQKCFSSQKAIQGEKIVDFLKEFFDNSKPAQYNLLLNNCQHFVFYFLTKVWDQKVSRSDVIQYNYEQLGIALKSMAADILGINKAQKEQKEEAKNFKVNEDETTTADHCANPLL